MPQNIRAKLKTKRGAVAQSVKGHEKLFNMRIRKLQIVLIVRLDARLEF